MTLQAFKDYILRQLGFPLHNIEMTDEQLTDCIQEAVDRFTERHYDATIESIYALNLIPGQNSYSLPVKIKSVEDLYPGNTIFSALDDNEKMLIPVQGQPFFDYLFKYPDVSTITMSRMNSKMWEDAATNQNIQFDFNATMHMLNIHGDVSRIIGDASNSGKIFLFVQECVVDTIIYGNRWLKKYAVALAKRQWAMNLKKFNDAPLPGGATLNHDGIMADANEEIEKLNEQLEDEFCLPPSFSIG